MSRDNILSLKNKVVLITGGSSGIGRQCAIQAAELGAKVIIIGRNEKELQNTINMMVNSSFHRYYVADLAVVDKIEPLIELIVAENGPVDCFCHAAGIILGRTLKMSKPKYVDKMMKIHVYAYLEIIRCLSLFDHLREGASLVGISSASVDCGVPVQAVYSSAKGAMNGSLNCLKECFLSRKIRINCIAFANVGSKTLLDGLGDDVANINSIQPLGLIDVESAANVVMFLFSDACRYITGEVIKVYAGLS